MTRRLTLAAASSICSTTSRCTLARWLPGGICSHTSGGCLTAAPTRPLTSTSRGCAASSAKPHSSLVTCTRCVAWASSSAHRRERRPMRLRIILLVVATSSLVLVSFLLPLALVLRALAADRAVSTATVQAQWMAPLAATLQAGSLRLAVDQVNAENKSAPVTVFLPGGGELGAPVPRSPAVQLAAKGHSFTSDAPGGAEVLVAVQGLPGGTAVIRTFVPDAELRHGVTRAWLLLGCVGLGLLVLSVAVADQLARSLVRPLTAVARVSDRLATGDLSARAPTAGPPEVRRAGAGLNHLARGIGELLAHERETVADLSHRLRTPMTALRIDAESLHDDAERAQLLDHVNTVERTVSKIIHDARRPARVGPGHRCDA